MPSPVRIYAGTQEGLFIWRSKNGSWEKVAVFFETGTIDSIDGLRSQPNVIYLGVTQDGLHRTDNAGKNWRRVFEGNVRAVTVDPTDEQVIYVGIEPIHLYRSEDGGKSWEELTGVQDLPVQVKAQWSYPRPPHREHVRHIFVHPDDPKILHVCLEHGGIIRSFDRGRSWQDVSGGIDYLDIHHISSAPSRKDLYFVATARGFFKSTDPGPRLAARREWIYPRLLSRFCFLAWPYTGDVGGHGRQVPWLLGSPGTRPGRRFPQPQSRRELGAGRRGKVVAGKYAADGLGASAASGRSVYRLRRSRRRVPRPFGRRLAERPWGYTGKRGSGR
jgi:photosystem II stability/assembly factor-like uncharacterized protein